MEIVRLSQGEMIARKNDTVKCWYMIQDGTVLQIFGEAKIQLGRNAIVGIFERDIYQCDYIAQTDCVLAEFVCNGAQDIKNILKGKENLFFTCAVIIKPLDELESFFCKISAANQV